MIIKYIFISLISLAVLTLGTYGNYAFAAKVPAKMISFKNEFQLNNDKIQGSMDTLSTDCEHLRLAIENLKEYISYLYYLAHQPPERLSEEEKQMLDDANFGELNSTLYNYNEIYRRDC